MDYVKPADIVVAMIGAGATKAALGKFDLLVRGALSGAPVSLADWWLWNQIPVTLGNLLGGAVFTGLALFVTYRRAAPRQTVPAALPQEG